MAQTAGLCMVRGVNEASAGKPLFLLAILFCGTFSWISVLIAQWYDLQTPFISHGLGINPILGGLLFGTGAAFNNGCDVSTISKLARGHVAMTLTIIGWLFGWRIEPALFQRIEFNIFEIPKHWNYSILLVLSILITIFITRLKQDDKKIWVAMMSIGLIAGIVFLYEPKWTPSGLLKDISLSFLESDQAIWPSLHRFLLFFSLLRGMVLAAIYKKTFNLELPGLKTCAVHLSAGIFMGIGASLAGGGNDSQLLLGLPSLSPAGISTVLSIILGIYLVKKLLPQFS